ncbi:hypothetical protein NDU88_002432 [Pleurodeles waltl]|uniref:Uncharacterized protein n=1 Tax=Pleurodeles waltl TaxID=8319 RepID=A0AAV7T3E6_PLEWA|nr:hypothetical protein NDU88_002432 [Pleurodeles waltl]
MASHIGLMLGQECGTLHLRAAEVSVEEGVLTPLTSTPHEGGDGCHRSGAFAESRQQGTQGSLCMAFSAQHAPRHKEGGMKNTKRSTHAVSQKAVFVNLSVRVDPTGVKALKEQRPPHRPHGEH